MTNTNISSCQTGLTNSPSNLQTETPKTCPVGGYAVALDFLTGTGQTKSIYPLLDFIADRKDWAIDDGGEDAPLSYTIGTTKYTSRARSVLGVVIHWFRNDKGLDEYHFSYPGKPFYAMNLLDQIRFCRGLKYAYKLKCTRIDIALDDYTRKITASMLQGAIRRGDYAGFQVADVIVQHRRDKDGVVHRVPTCYLGSKQSPKRVCMYDAEYVHNISANRWELRWRGDYAQWFFDYLCDDAMKWNDGWNHSGDERMQFLGEVLSKFVGGAVRFIKRNSDSNITRCRNIQWWDRWLKKLGGVLVLKVPKIPKTLDRTLGWLERQVAKTLTILSYGCGYGDFKRYINQLVEYGSWRLNKDDLVLVEYLMRNSEPLSL